MRSVAGSALNQIPKSPEETSESACSTITGKFQRDDLGVRQAKRTLSETASEASPIEYSLLSLRLD